MKKALLTFGILTVLILFTGCGGENSKTQEKSPDKNIISVPEKPQKDEEWGKTLVSLAKQHGNRGGHLMFNIIKAMKMEPEKSRTGLLKVIEKKLPDWDFAFSLLDHITDSEFPGLKNALLKIYRQDGCSGSKSDAIYLLAKIGHLDIASEVLEYLKTKNPSFDTGDFEKCALMLKKATPPGLKEYIYSLFELKPLKTGASLGPMAEILGKIDPENSIPLLEKLILEESWDEKGYIGALRGLGATKNNKAKDIILRFINKIQEMLDNKQIVLVRKYGTSQINAYAELSRFSSEDVWECLLLYHFTSIRGTENEEALVKEAITKIPENFIKTKAVEWENQEWKNDKNYKPKNSEARKLMRGEVLLSEKLDENYRDYQISMIDKLKNNTMFDGNITDHLKKLTPYLRAKDKDVYKYFKDFASKKGHDRFTSRSYARQILEEFKDPYLLELIVNDDYYGDTSDWIRIREWEAKILPGLSDKFVKKEIKGGIGSNGLTDVVFKFLGAESRKDVFEKIKTEIKKSMNNPKNTLMMTYVTGLTHWKTKDADLLLKEIISTYEKQGIPLSGWQTNNINQEKQMIMNVAMSVLASRGDKEAFKTVYSRKPLLYNCEWTGVPDEFKPFMNKDYGPITLHWPTLEDVLSGK